MFWWWFVFCTYTPWIALALSGARRCTELVVMFSVHHERRIVWVLIQSKFTNFALMIRRVSVKWLDFTDQRGLTQVARGLEMQKAPYPKQAQPTVFLYLPPYTFLSYLLSISTIPKSSCSPSHSTNWGGLSKPRSRFSWPALQCNKTCVWHVMPSDPWKEAEEVGMDVNCYMKVCVKFNFKYCFSLI